MIIRLIAVVFLLIGFGDATAPLASGRVCALELSKLSADSTSFPQHYIANICVEPITIQVLCHYVVNLNQNLQEAVQVLKLELPGWKRDSGQAWNMTGQPPAISNITPLQISSTIHCYSVDIVSVFVDNK